MSYTPVDELDSGEIDFSEDPTDDNDITSEVLFATILSDGSAEDVQKLAEEWKELFDGS